MTSLRLAVVLVLASGIGAEYGAADQSSVRPAYSLAPRLTSFVDPLIGTGGHGHTYPGPSLPFGMIQPGPDTRFTGWDSSSGYHYSDTRILGFSHTHLSGTGIPDYNDVLVMPTTGGIGPETLRTGAEGTPGYASSYTHAEEEAQPGYYAVTLRDSGIRAELTTTLRAGIHRCAFPRGRPAHVVLDLTHRDEVIDSSIAIAGDREVSGSTSASKESISRTSCSINRSVDVRRLGFRAEVLSPVLMPVGESRSGLRAFAPN